MTVKCDETDCVHNKEGWCTTTHITLESYGTFSGYLICAFCQRTENEVKDESKNHSQSKKGIQQRIL